jgi:hypothetical protein
MMDSDDAHPDCAYAKDCLASARRHTLAIALLQEGVGAAERIFQTGEESGLEAWTNAVRRYLQQHNEEG